MREEDRKRETVRKKSRDKRTRRLGGKKKRERAVGKGRHSGTWRHSGRKGEDMGRGPIQRDGDREQLSQIQLDIKERKTDNETCRQIERGRQGVVDLEEKRSSERQKTERGRDKCGERDQYRDGERD